MTRSSPTDHETQLARLANFVKGANVLLSRVPKLPSGGYDKTSPQWQMYEDWLATQPEEYNPEITQQHKEP